MEQFLNDPKNILSLVACILSFSAICITAYNFIDQHKKWRVINEGILELNEINFLVTKEYDAEIFEKIEWGYYAEARTKFEKNVNDPDKYQIFHTLALTNENGSQIIPLHRIYTLSDAVEKINELKIQSLNLEIKKKVIIAIEFKNIGNTAIYIQEIKWNIVQWESEFSYNMNNKILERGKTYGIQAICFLSINDRIPDNLEIRLSAKYKTIKDNRKERKFTLIHDKLNAVWTEDNSKKTSK